MIIWFYVTPLRLAAEHNNVDIVNLLLAQSGINFHDGIFSKCKKLTNIIIPALITQIPSMSFYYCSSLTIVSIPESVTSIGDFAFSKCYSLSIVSIPCTVVDIGKSSFSCCVSLIQISLPSSVTSIKEYTFYKCTSLSRISIPSSITKIEDFAFFECKSLIEVSIPQSITSFGRDVFGECPLLDTQHIPFYDNALNVSSYKQQLNLIDTKMQSIEEQTPSELIKEFEKLNGAIIDLKSLVTKIHDVSIENNCQFVSICTGESKKTQVFGCKFHNSSFQCKAFVKFYYEKEENKIILDTMNNTHNHLIGQVKTGRSRNTLTSTQKQSIYELTIKGFTSGRIRLLENLTCSPYSLYSARRKAIKEMRSNEMQDTINEMKKWSNWTNIIYKNKSNKFEYSYSFYEPVINSTYVNSLVIVDDTMCTNFYNYALFVMLCVDENLHDQVLGFSLLPNKTTKSFVNFLLKVKERVGNIKVFLTDRCMAQIQALKCVWPEAKIIFCAVHIARNIKTEVNGKILYFYTQMRKGIISEKELIQEFCKYINKHLNDARYARGVHLLSNLIKEREHWMPSEIDSVEHFYNDSTNRVEGFFGNLKDMTDHSVLTFPILIRSVFILAKRFSDRSSKQTQIAIDTNILSTDDQAKLSNVALEKVQYEFDEIDLDDDEIYSDECCVEKIVLGIPCKHLMRRRKAEGKHPLLTIEDFSKRWIHGINYNVEINVKTTVNLETLEENEQIDFRYASLLGMFEKYFSMASKSPAIQIILSSMFEQLKNTEVETQSSGELKPPNSLAIPGARNTHPRRNVDYTDSEKKSHENTSHPIGESKTTYKKRKSTILINEISSDDE